MRCSKVAKSFSGSCIVARTNNWLSSCVFVLSGCVTYILSRARLAARLYFSVLLWEI